MAGAEPAAATTGHGGTLIKQGTYRGDSSTKIEHLGLDTITRILCPWHNQGAKYNKHKGGKKATFWQIFTLLRRLAIFAAALVYISTSIQATVSFVRVLRALPSSSMEMGMYQSRLIPLWAGTGTIRQSALVKLALQDSTTPINQTIYLDSATTVSRTGCAAVPTFNPAIYGNTYLRTLATALLTQTSYNLTFLAPVELIAPVVDCSFDGLLLGMQTTVRSHYLVRHKNNTENVSLLTFSMSMQDYSIPKQNQKGPAGIATLQVITDMASTSPVSTYYVVAQSYPYAALRFQVYSMIGLTVDHEWRLRSIPAIVILETPKELVTASRTGFYINVETEQSNIKNANAVPDTLPRLILSQWRWKGGPVLRDSWGWVHCVHIFFAIDALVSMIVLFLVIYRNLLKGKIWVGDAFVSVSNTLLYRGAIVLLTWVVNDGWTLLEFCYANANDISQLQVFHSEPAIIRADLLTLFLSLASVVGSIFSERIDPALVILLFEIGFGYRTEIGRAYPTVKASLTEYATNDLILGTLQMSPIVAQTTPARLWTTHELASKNVGFILSSLLPTFSLLGVVILYVAIRKVYRHYYPEKLHIVKVSDFSEKVDELKGMKRTLTLFEVATGAALQRRVGVVSDYENCLFIKGMKYASADGIYCNGYVIANDKWLIATADLLALLVMKLIRLRFKNIYVYEVDGSTVQQTARLVYPQTISWYDLVRLNISVLS